jgi:hypothetical protein
MAPAGRERNGDAGVGGRMANDGSVGRGVAGGIEGNKTFFHLKSALLGNFSPTPRVDSYHVVLEQQKRCSKTLASFVLQLHRVLKLRYLAKKLVGVTGVQL